jgi:hypothetical protein
MPTFSITSDQATVSWENAGCGHIARDGLSPFRHTSSGVSHLGAGNAYRLAAVQSAVIRRARSSAAAAADGRGDSAHVVDPQKQRAQAAEFGIKQALWLRRNRRSAKYHLG